MCLSEKASGLKLKPVVVFKGAKREVAAFSFHHRLLAWDSFKCHNKENISQALQPKILTGSLYQEGVLNAMLQSQLDFLNEPDTNPFNCTSSNVKEVYLPTCCTMLSSIVLKLYFALIYGIVIWGSTYESTLKPIFILQKKSIRIITFSPFDCHSSPFV